MGARILMFAVAVAIVALLGVVVWGVVRGLGRPMSHGNSVAVREILEREQQFNQERRGT
ncbi:MAG: hypothetical protein ACOC9H_02885 [Gemmatimonadota bacterium]